ncbi:Mechanosensitive ion channel [Sesbania bispinosa]|nr:Mechanosensitive ion channel [Sesbania bispinosa]
MERRTGRGGYRRGTPWTMTAVHHETVAGVHRDWSSPGQSARDGIAAEVLMRNERSEQQNGNAARRTVANRD